LSAMARGLELTADALGENDPVLAARSLATLRHVGVQLAEISRLGMAGERVARHSMLWRSQLDPVMREHVNADRLDLLGAGCMMLARSAFELPTPDRIVLARPVRELARVLSALASAPGDYEVRNRAVADTLQALRPYSIRVGELDSSVVLAAALLHIVAADIMIFSGLTSEQARTALSEGSPGALVSTPPPAPRIPFGLDRWKLGGDQ
jgi:hypothetical protein